MFEFMTVIKAIADTNRVRIISMLRGRELCVCQITKLLELAPSTVSKHLFILRQARLIEDRKEGRWMYYRLSDNPNPTIKTALSMIADSLINDDKIKKDNKLITDILSIGKEELCKKEN